MITPGNRSRYLFEPVVFLNGVNLCDWEGVTAMTSNNDGVAFEDDAGVSFAGFGFPAD